MRAVAGLAVGLALGLVASLVTPPGVAVAQGATSPSDATSDAVPASARLTVVPDGPQRLDLATLVTELPEGGRIVDAETGLALDAERIRFLEGAFVEADGVSAELEAARFDAPRLEVDLAAGRAVAPDGVAYVGAGLEVSATSARIVFGPDLVRFDAPRARRPDLEARALLVDVASGAAWLLGPYRYAEGLLTLRDDREDAILQIVPTTTDAGEPTYRAANTVDDALRTRFAPLRP
ncbi:MAG: hypothetical protein RI554_10460 [Trueperaceae bacterium]|nr:hypothetical protein [Trueperaceae bacterium]